MEGFGGIDSEIFNVEQFLTETEAGVGNGGVWMRGK